MGICLIVQWDTTCSIVVGMAEDKRSLTLLQQTQVPTWLPNSVQRDISKVHAFAVQHDAGSVFSHLQLNVHVTHYIVRLLHVGLQLQAVQIWLHSCRQRSGHQIEESWLHDVVREKLRDIEGQPCSVPPGQEVKCAVSSSIEGSEEGTQYCRLLTGECGGCKDQAPRWQLEDL